MPELPPARRGSGPQRPRRRAGVELDYERDWYSPPWANAEELQRRPPPTPPDQSRYGRRPSPPASEAELAMLDAAEARAARPDPELGL